MTQAQRAELLGRISSRLIHVMREAEKAFQIWRNARSRTNVAEPQLADYLRLNRRCHYLKRAERRLAA